jgi:hypothetical protein
VLNTPSFNWSTEQAGGGRFGLAVAIKIAEQEIDRILRDDKETNPSR